MRNFQISLLLENWVTIDYWDQYYGEIIWNCNLKDYENEEKSIELNQLFSALYFWYSLKNQLSRTEFLLSYCLSSKS